ncbi:recombinase family protein [Clostridiaceae bacterium OttesenSCG-928-D20]|nr:recombinase family protein [Clostridiaceae bacterium OttesenSCG-928-D20]
MPKYKGAEYVRLSYSDDKSTESDSVLNQQKLIDDYLSHHPEIAVVDRYVDDGYSGLAFDRPEFQRMMRDVEDGKINCIIVKDLSRLGREYIETGRYLRRVFPAYGVRFIAITDNIDTATDSYGEDLAVSVKNIINEAYCRDISIKTRSALNTKRKEGDFVGWSAVYGYLKSEENKNQLIIDEYAAEVVRDIFRMRLEGMSVLHISKELNQRGILSPIMYKKEQGLPYPKGGYAGKEDAKWSATTIIRMLQDETYTGTLNQGRHSNSNYKLKDNAILPVDEWVRVEDAHEPIIRKHDFDLVQRIRYLDTRTAPDGQAVHLFSGMLTCACCGQRMTRKTVPYKDTKYYYYCCPTGKKNGCTTPMLKETELTECVLAIAKAHIDNVIALDELLSSMDVELINQNLVNKYEHELATNREKLERAKGFKMRLHESLISGILSRDEYNYSKKMYNDDIAALDEANAILQTELENVLNNTSERRKWIEHFRQFQTMQTLDRKALIHLVQSISIISKTHIEVTFAFQLEYEAALAVLQSQQERRAS